MLSALLLVLAAQAPAGPGSRFIVTAEPINVGSSPKMCVAVDPDDARGVWWWEPGSDGCASRSTGPEVFKGDEGHVTRTSDAIEAGFRLGLHVRDHIDVRLIVAAGRMRAPDTGADVPVAFRNDLNIPDLPALGRAIERRGAFACSPTPAVNLLPVVAPMAGSRPIWMVDGAAGAWSGSEERIKTLWIVARDVDGPLRVTGRRLDGNGALAFEHDGQPRTPELVIENPRNTSVRPGGATDDVMRAYAFIPSYVIYPSAGCWEVAASLGTTSVRITIDNSVR